MRRAVTGEETVRSGLFETSPTEAPPLAAAAVRETVQVVLAGVMKDDGLQASEAIPALAAGLSANWNGTAEPLALAVIVATVVVATAVADTAKEALLAPAATETEAGTVSAAAFDWRLTVTLLGATALNPTVQLDVPGVLMPPDPQVSEATLGVGGPGGGGGFALELTTAFSAKFSPLAASAAPVTSSKVTVMLCCPATGCWRVAGADQNGLKLAGENAAVCVVGFHCKSSTICLPPKCFKR